MNSTFIASCNVNEFIKNYLPTYRALKYEIGFVSNALTKRDQQFSSDILHITFHQL